MEFTLNLTMRKADNKITNALNTEDLWKLMLRRVPPIVSEYFRGGADNEIFVLSSNHSLLLMVH